MLFSFLYFVLLCPFAVPPTNNSSPSLQCWMCSRWLGAREERSIDDRMKWKKTYSISISHYTPIDIGDSVEESSHSIDALFIVHQVDHLVASTHLLSISPSLLRVDALLFSLWWRDCISIYFYVLNRTLDGFVACYALWAHTKCHPVRPLELSLFCFLNALCAASYWWWYSEVDGCREIGRWSIASEGLPLCGNGNAHFANYALFHLLLSVFRFISGFVCQHLFALILQGLYYLLHTFRTNTVCGPSPWVSEWPVLQCFILCRVCCLVFMCL